jgi:hypothetical protein
MFEKIKDIFKKHHKNIKFYALMFVVIVLLSLALAPDISSDISYAIVGDNFKIRDGGNGSCVTKVRFAPNLVSSIHTY